MSNYDNFITNAIRSEADPQGAFKAPEVFRPSRLYPLGFHFKQWTWLTSARCYPYPAVRAACSTTHTVVSRLPHTPPKGSATVEGSTHRRTVASSLGTLPLRLALAQLPHLVHFERVGSWITSMSASALGKGLFKVWGRYEHSLRTRPLQTQMVTSTVLW